MTEKTIKILIDVRTTLTEAEINVKIYDLINNHLPENIEQICTHVENYEQ